MWRKERLNWDLVSSEIETDTQEEDAEDEDKDMSMTLCVLTSKSTFRFISGTVSLFAEEIARETDDWILVSVVFCSEEM